MSSFLFNFSKSNSIYSQTLPQNSCVNGFPVELFSGNAYEASEMLYSVWNSYQKTLGAVFSNNQALSKAPSTSSINGPENIFIIRHGEKNSSQPNYKLNNNGIYRACKLINFVNELAYKGYPISYIITCNPCPYNADDSSMRPEQTISMVSFMLNIPIFIFGSSQEFTTTTNKLFNSGIFNGLNVLMCWEHSAIQGLCLNILNSAGVNGRLPSDVISVDP